jgi:glutamyl-tRNA synthetase
MSREVRVRFAPSPTGALHIGGVRTALYNYLFAKKNGGKFILRIEDTDQTRYVEGAEQYIMDSLSWLGITPDESPLNPGEVGPYRQSERKASYMEYAEKLVKDGNAYYAFDTSEELDEMRVRLKAANVAMPQYNALSRTTMKNSLTLSEEEVKRRIDAGEPYVIRLKVPRKEEIRLNDMMREWVMVQSSSLDDKVLMKSDGMPTYHLANVVDDYKMGITHVIRGEEWLPSAPSHVLLYRYLGWEDVMPEMAHLPLILKPDGNGKLSKRAADKLGFPIFPLNWTDPQTGDLSKGYMESGYLPETVINFLSLLGWNPGTEQELFTLDQLENEFSVERIGKAGAKFDLEKAKWFNQQYIKAKTDTVLAESLLEQLKERSIDADLESAALVCGMMKERVVFMQDFHDDAKFFFEKPISYDEKVIKKKWTSVAVDALSAFAAEIESLTSFSPDEAKEALVVVLERLEIGLGKVMPCLRVALSGQGGGPDLMSILSFLGPKEVAERLRGAIETLPVKEATNG